MRPKKIAYVVVLLLLLPVVAIASPYEASGTVIEVLDGNTFAVRIEKFDPRIKQDVERVTLADLEVLDEATMIVESIVESMNESIDESIDESINGSIDESMNGSIDESMNGSIDESMNGSIDESMNESIYEVPSAKDLAAAILLNKTVWLDIDDGSEDGRNSEGELIAVLYLSGLDGRPVTSPSFNRMLVDYKIARLNDSDANEFDPADWWPQENISIEYISAEEGSGVEEDAGAKTTGLNIDINPTKPNVNVDISRPNIAINPTKPKVNVNLTGPKVNINPAKPSINVNPSKPVIDVNPTTTEPNATENETSEALSSETVPGTSGTAALPFADSDEPLVLSNSTVPITLINPTGSITLINSTGQVTLIDPAKPVKVINSTEIPKMEDINDWIQATILTDPQRAANLSRDEPVTNSTELVMVAKSNDTEASDIFVEAAAEAI